jgi:hypothetical protein
VIKRTEAVYIRWENGAGKEMGGREGKVEVPHLLATPSNVSDQTTVELTILLYHTDFPKT